MKNKKIAKLLLLTFFVSVSAGSFAQQDAPKKWAAAMKQFDVIDETETIKEGAVLFVGSSSITMWKDIQTFFPEYTILNRGFGGSTFPDLIDYTPRVIYPYKPSKIFIYEGDNDIAGGKAPDAVFKDAVKLREMISEVMPDVPVVFISAKPSISRWHLKEQYTDFNKQIKRYARRTKLTMYADVWSAMLDKKGNVYPVFLKDNLHMTPEGYKLWQKVIVKFLPQNKTD